MLIPLVVVVSSDVVVSCYGIFAPGSGYQLDRASPFYRNTTVL